MYSNRLEKRKQPKQQKMYSAINIMSFGRIITSRPSQGLRGGTEPLLTHFTHHPFAPYGVASPSHSLYELRKQATRTLHGAACLIPSTSPTSPTLSTTVFSFGSEVFFLGLFSF
ncbi:hypothetical protein VTI74DRAFT_8668 [Chaetomium olivicolor]